MTDDQRADDPGESPHTTALSGGLGRRLFGEANAIDYAIYDAMAATATPVLDVAMTRVSNAANYARVWFVVAAALAATDGRRGQGAATRGMAAVGAASLTANLVAKHLFPRGRPERSTANAGRQARMPTSSSFPSGHAASAFAFATAVTADYPVWSLPLYALAATVGYSRIHMGVHYLSDVVGGGLLGLAVGTAARSWPTGSHNR